MSTEAEKVLDITLDIKLLIKLIPEFDGSFNKLNGFIDGVNEAIRLAKPEQKAYLIPFIKAGLKGPAKSVTLTVNYSNWDSLKKKLIETFGERKSFAQIQIELQNCKQFKTENISSFTQRVEGKIQKLLTTLAFENEGKIDQSQTDLIKRMGLTAFINNCSIEYGQLLRIRNPSTLTEASRLAHDEEIALNLRRYSHNYKSNNNYNVQPTTHKTQSFCNYCKKQGHSSEKCFHKSNKQNLNFCSYCKKNGHTIERCFLRNNNSQFPKNSNVSKNGERTSFGNQNPKPENPFRTNPVELTQMDNQTQLYPL